MTPIKRQSSPQAVKKRSYQVREAMEHLRLIFAGKGRRLGKRFARVRSRSSFMIATFLSPTSFSGSGFGSDSVLTFRKSGILPKKLGGRANRPQTRAVQETEEKAGTEGPRVAQLRLVNLIMRSHKLNSNLPSPCMPRKMKPSLKSVRCRAGRPAGHRLRLY